MSQAESLGVGRSLFHDECDSLATTLSVSAPLTIIPQPTEAVPVGKTSASLSIAQLRVASSGDGTVTIILHGRPADVYQLERSADLSRWESVTNLVLDASGKVEFRDVASGAQQFYRVREK